MPDLLVFNSRDLAKHYTAILVRDFNISTQGRDE